MAVRGAAALAVIAALACSPGPAPVPADTASPPEGRDRESWDVQLQLHDPTATVTVEAPYLADDLAAGQTRADSGVTVTLADSAGAVTTRLSAHRLVVDHETHGVTLSGQVSATGGGVRLRADSLAWDRDRGRFLLTAGADLGLPGGRLRAVSLSGDSDLRAWTATAVHCSFADSASGDSVRLEGSAADLRVEGGRVTARFDEAVAHWRGRRFTAGTALYAGGAGRLRLAGGVAVADSGRQLLADTVQVQLSTRAVAARGHVRVEGAVAVTAAHLGEDGRGRVEATGAPVRVGEDAQGRTLGTCAPVRVDVDGRTLEARRVVVSAGQDTVLARGGVVLTEGERQVHADTVRLVRPDSFLVAAGDVRLEADDVEGVLRAQHLQSAAGGRRVRLWGQPRLRRARDDGDDLVLRADTLRLDGDAGRLRGTGGFVLEAPPHVRLTAARGVYGTAGDSAGLAGAVIFEYLAEGSRSRLQADTCGVVLKRGAPQGLHWPRGVSGSLQDRQQVSWLQAEAGTAQLAEGRLRQLALTGDVEVTHRGGQGGRLSRFRAQRMELVYNDTGVLHRVHAEGGAVVRTRLSAEAGEAAVNEVKGERLDVELAAGAVVAVRVLSGVEGRYTPAEEED